MKGALLVLALVAASLVGVIVAKDADIKYAGTTVGSDMWGAPYFDNTNTCSGDTNTAPYVTFNVSFSSAGVREVSAMAELSFKSAVRIYVYKGTFDKTAPCTNLIGFGIQGNDFGADIPPLDSFEYFEPGTYVFVVTGDTGGLFAVAIEDSDSKGQTTNNSATWLASDYSGDSDYTCIFDTDTPNYVNYASFQYTPTVSGYYDVTSLWVNDSIVDFYSTLFIYIGVPLQNGLSTDPCNATLTNATLYESAAGGDGVYLGYLYFSQYEVYTIVVSGAMPDFIGYYGIQVVPTRVRFQKPTPFTQPARDLSAPCAEGGSTEASWDAILFTTENRAYLIDTGNPPYPYTGFDTYSFLYRGSNLGDGVNAPPACPIFATLVYAADTGDITPLFAQTDVGVNYTVIVSTYAGGNKSENDESIRYAYTLYLYTGTPIGVLPPSTTGTTTTGTTTAATTAATGQTTTTAATGQTTTTGTGQTTQTTTGTTTTTTAKTTTGASTTTTTTTTSKVSTTGVVTTGNTTATGNSTTTSKATTASTTTTTGSKVSTSTTSDATLLTATLACVFVSLFALF